MDEGESTLLGACTLDHDGCVVCSDAGIPLRVVTLEGDDAHCVDALGNVFFIAVELVQPVEVGEVIVTHGGVAIGRVVPSPPDPLSHPWERGRRTAELPLPQATDNRLPSPAWSGRGAGGEGLRGVRG